MVAGRPPPSAAKVNVLYGRPIRDLRYTSLVLAHNARRTPYEFSGSSQDSGEDLGAVGMSDADAPRGNTPTPLDVLDRLSLSSDTPPPGPSFGMENSRLPIELCEAIMDAVIDSRHFLPPDEHETLMACRAVCRDWGDHALDLLNKLAILDSPHSVSSFVSAIRRTSVDRAYFV
ncbi:hypothetical protein C8Q79DRAFT_1014673 [Trametes meyenii]|nr:hypothetical protein C8Q79DRAFT_1014673 [Trametes meyenii]